MGQQPDRYDFVAPTPPAQAAVTTETRKQVEQQLANGVQICPMCHQPVNAQPQQRARVQPQQQQQQQYGHVPAMPPAGRGFGEVQQK